MTRDPLLKTFRIPARLLATVLMLVTFNLSAAPANKCVVNGTVTYQQGACPSDTSNRKVPTIQELNAEQQKRRAAESAATKDKKPPQPATDPSGFQCDGRQYCSQMTSCAEAKYFLARCPNVKMDGDHNGVPCEQQWCGH